MLRLQENSNPFFFFSFLVLIRHKKDHKPKLLSPDIFRWGGGLPCEGGGAKKFGMSLETRKSNCLGGDISGFCWDIPAVPEKFENKKTCVQFFGA